MPLPRRRQQLAPADHRESHNGLQRPRLPPRVLRARAGSGSATENRKAKPMNRNRMRTVGPVATFILVFLCVPTARAQIIIQNGGLWEFDVHANLRACLGGSCASSSASDSTQVDVPSGAIVNVGILVGSCAAAVDPQQVAALSEYVPAKHGRQKLQITDRKALRGLLADCTGYAGFRLMRMTGRLEQAPDGN